MRVTEIIKLMPTQFRQVTNNPLVAGHHVPLIGTWTQETGYVKEQSLQWLNESLACPIIAIVDEKIGGEDLVLNITAKTSVYSSTEEKTQGEYTIKRKKYSPTETTVKTTLTIPRHTRPWGTFLLSGLGKNVYEISSMTDNAIANVGKVNFYALASKGSRIIYWFGLHHMAELLREILNGIWIAPTKCIRCGATGIEPDTESDTCLQCNGYRFSGYNATKWIQRMKGFDVGLAREVLDWDNLTQADHQLIEKFINKCWTQKWWVTPTENEIKRLFSHFYNVNESEIKIQKRYHPQEPVWHLSLPIDLGEGSPFGTLTQTDRELMEFIAESLTPAGVNVFVGFYWGGIFGNFDDFTSSLPVQSFGDLDSVAFGEEFGLWGMPRWKDWSGWTKAIDNFEDVIEGIYEATETFTFEELNQPPSNWVDGSLGASYAKIIQTKSDHHKPIECYFDGTNDYSITYNFNNPPTGDTFIELFFEITDLSAINCGIGVNEAGVGDQAGILLGDLGSGSGLYDGAASKLASLSVDTMYRLKMVFDQTNDTYDVFLATGSEDYAQVGTGIGFANPASSQIDSLVIFSLNILGGASHTLWIDAVGMPFEDAYQAEENRYGRDLNLIDESVWDMFGDVTVVNVNDMNRHMVKFTDNSYVQRNVDGQGPTGSMSLWIHPEDVDMLAGLYGTGLGGKWLVYIKYKISEEGFYDNNDNLLRKAKPNCDYHIGMDFNTDTEKFDAYIERELLATGIGFKNSVAGVGTPVFRIQATGTGNGYFDALGVVPNNFAYSRFENWQRLYPVGYGWGNKDYATGQRGTIMEQNLHDKYISIDQFWDVFEP